MRLLGWWKNKEQKTAHVPQLAGPAQGPAFPEYAQHGNFFRTRTFNKLESGNHLATWYQAVESPVSGKWLVQEIWRQPNMISHGSEPVNQRRTLNDGRAVSFEEALRMLGGFEFSRQKMGFLPCAEPSLEELGDTHVERFALLNEVVFDEYGHPNMTSHGYIVTDGYFSPEKEKAVLEIYKKSEKGLLPWGKAGPLSRFFEEAVLVEQPDTFLDLKESYIRWQKFTDKVYETVGWLILLQNKEFTGSVHILKDVPIIWPVSGHKDVPIEGYYKAARSEAEDMVVSLTHVSEFDKRNVYQKFLRSLDLVYEVAYAKYLLVNMENGKDAELSRQAQKKAAGLCHMQGGSSQDVAGLMAEIIGCQARRVKGWSGDMSGQFWRIMESSILTKKVCHYKEISSDDLSPEVYYCPDAVIDFLGDMKKTGAEFKQRMDAECGRIVKPLNQLPAPTPNPEEGPQ